VYCSAHWCPPCRQFTPLLGEFFKSQAAALKVAVVFATGDRDEKSFKDYFARFACDINDASYFQFNLLHNSKKISFHVQSRVGLGHALRRLPHRHVHAGMRV
jgi:thiol-disulfide isomerase/thioredoxin